VTDDGVDCAQAAELASAKALRANVVFFIMVVSRARSSNIES
jgi:hypothetical protein